MANLAGPDAGQQTAGGGAADDDAAPVDRAQERRRSQVRICVTYGVTAGYLLVTGYLVWFLTLGAEAPNLDAALGIFAGLSSVATGVIGFWFGNRKAIQDLHAFAGPPPAGAGETGTTP